MNGVPNSYRHSRFNQCYLNSVSEFYANKLILSSDNLITEYTHFLTRVNTSNLAERVNEEIRRRQRVIRIFPNGEAATRLIGSLLAELCDEWLSKLRYLDMEEYWDWKQECASGDTPNDKVIGLNQQ